MKKFIFIAILFFSLVSFGQTPMDRIVFFDSIGKETFSKEYHSKKVIKEYNLEKTSYEVEFFSKKNNIDVLKYRCFVNDKTKFTRHGECMYYFDSGVKREVENYNNGLLFGNTKEWYEDGKLCFEGEYKLEKKGVLLYHYNYWDKSGNQKLKDGNGIFEKFRNEEKTVLIYGDVKNGLKEGLWKTNNFDYPKVEETYEKGVLIKGKLIKSKNETRIYDSSNANGGPKEGMNEFRINIAKKIKKSGITSKIKGVFKVKFVVEIDGSLSNFEIITSLNNEVDNKILEILKNYPKWNSGIYNGREVKQYYTLPITLDFTN